MNEQRKKLKLRRVILETVMWVVTLIHIYPIFLVAISALKPKEDLYDNPIALPARITFDNFINAFNKMDYLRSLFNTLLLVSITVFIIIFLSSAASYAIVRRNTKFYNKLYFFFLAGMMMPFHMIMIPLFKYMTMFKLINTYHGIIIVWLGITAGFSMFVFSGFIKTVPKELEESGLIDGCGLYRIYFLIVFPILKPVVATLTVLMTFRYWNDFLMPMLFLSKNSMKPLVPRLASFVGEYFNDWSLIFSAIFMIVYPVLVVYIFAQKYIIKGLTAGAVKG
jgi:raffinose/stachyose/melibiose transport system permease protein